MNILFFDTETTNKLLFGTPLDHPDQPEVVQLGAILTDEHLNEKARLDVIVIPDGPISPGAAAVHGISDEDAKKFGISREAAVLAFDDLLASADRIVAHNIAFDVPVMKRAYLLDGRSSIGFDEVEQVCTMRAATPVCRVPHKRMRHPGDFKWPTLDEAHRYFFDKGVDGAHNALVDVVACKGVYQMLAEMKALGPGLTPAKKSKEHGA